jgi:hypothetical protein
MLQGVEGQGDGNLFRYDNEMFAVTDKVLLVQWVSLQLAALGL